MAQGMQKRARTPVATDAYHVHACEERMLVHPHVPGNEEEAAFVVRLGGDRQHVLPRPLSHPEPAASGLSQSLP